MQRRTSGHSYTTSARATQGLSNLLRFVSRLSQISVHLLRKMSKKWLREMSLFSCQYSYLPLFDHRGICRAKSIGQICQKRPVTKKLPLLGALSFNGAGERTSAYPLRGSAPASAACRRPRQLAKSAPRFLDARSFAGSSPRDGPITKKPPLLGALSFNGAGERT